MTPMLESRGGASAVRYQPDSSHFRVAVIGLGNAGHTLHLPALAGMTSATVVGAVDPDASRRERAASAWKVPVFAEFDEMLREAKPNVVVIGTPPDSHFDYCLRSFAAGAHVICEKPFTSSIDEANQVIEAARRGQPPCRAESRVPRDADLPRPPRRGSRDGRDVVFAQVWQLMDLPPWAEPGWRGQMLQRTLYEAGVHLVDFLMALFGERPRFRVGVGVDLRRSRERERRGRTLTLEFCRGRLAQIIQNRLCKGETQYFEVRAETMDASLRASFGGRARITAGLHRSTRRMCASTTASPEWRGRRWATSVGRLAGIRRSPA